MDDLKQAQAEYNAIIDSLFDNILLDKDAFDPLFIGLPSVTRRLRRAMEEAASKSQGMEADLNRLGAYRIAQDTSGILAAIAGYRQRKGLQHINPNDDFER